MIGVALHEIQVLGRRAHNTHAWSGVGARLVAEAFLPRAFEMLANAPFDVTGHPATRVPCGMSDGLPGGDDADREALRRGVNLSRGVGVGEGGGLEGIRA